VIHSTRSDTTFPLNFAEYSRFGKTFRIKVVDLKDDLYFMAHTYGVSEEKCEGKKPLSKSRRKRKHAIKIQIIETGRESVDFDPNGLGYRKSGGLLCTRVVRSCAQDNVKSGATKCGENT
jgi:hypothetical protein